MKNNHSSILLWLILSITIIAPLNNDIFVASIPAVNKEFNIHHAQWLLSFGLLSIACSQLFIGSLMDKYGRKPIIIICLILFVIGGLGVLLSPSFNSMLVFRVIQSFGASCSIVGAIAIAKDLVHKDKLITYTAFIFGIISISPLLAPVIGSYLQSYFDWYGAFTCLVCIGLFYLAVIAAFFRESIQTKDNIKIRSLFNAYFNLLRNKLYVNYIIVNCISYIMIFSFIAVSSTIIIDKFHYNVLAYGYIFLLFSITLFSMNICVPKMSKHTSLVNLTLVGVLLMLFGSIFMIISNIVSHQLMAFIAPMIIIGIGCGIIRPTASAAVMQLFPAKVAGKTIAFYGFAFYITAGIATLFVNHLIKNNLLPFAIFLTSIAFIAVIYAIRLKGNFVSS